VDFIRGAAEALDCEGKPIIALPSITNKGESKISPLIKHGKVLHCKVLETQG
jgi:acyl-CoA hydrolase